MDKKGEEGTYKEGRHARPARRDSFNSTAVNYKQMTLRGLLNPSVTAFSFVNIYMFIHIINHIFMYIFLDLSLGPMSDTSKITQKSFWLL